MLAMQALNCVCGISPAQATLSDLPFACELVSVELFFVRMQLPEVEDLRDTPF